MTALMSACVVVVVAMVASINLALPALAASDLRPSSTGLLWIVDAYILVFGCLLIPAGALADRLGRKGILLAGLGIFATGCVASALAPTLPVLLVTRGLTGLGAALVMPATLSLLLQVTPAERKAQAIATWSAATGAAGALGLLGGGLILEWLPWQGLFLTVGPLAGVLALLVALVAPRGDRHAASLDLVGAALATTSVFLLLLAIIEGPERGWTSGAVLGAATGAALLFVVFVRHALSSDQPMLDPRVFAIPRLRSGALGVAAVFFGLFALFFVNAQYLQYAKGYSPLVTGVAILPLPLAMIVVSRRSVAIAGRVGVRRVVTSGLALLALGLGSLSLVSATTPYVAYGLGLVLVAAGMGLSVPLLSTGIVTSLPAAQAGVGSGINSAVRELGAALGVAVVGSVVATTFERSLPADLQDRGDSVFQTVRAAEALGSAAHADAVAAFTHAMSLGLRVVALVVAVGAIATARGIAAADRADAADPSADRTEVAPLLDARPRRG